MIEFKQRADYLTCIVHSMLNGNTVIQLPISEDKLDQKEHLDFFNSLSGFSAKIIDVKRTPTVEDMVVRSIGIKGIEVSWKYNVNSEYYNKKPWWKFWSN